MQDSVLGVKQKQLSHPVATLRPYLSFVDICNYLSNHLTKVNRKRQSYADHPLEVIQCIPCQSISNAFTATRRADTLTFGVTLYTVEY